MLKRHRHIAFLLLLLPIALYAEHNDIHAEADRPGAGTGTNVLDKGFIQWETGFEVMHYWDIHSVTLPNTLFRFGLCPWAELRFEYTGRLSCFDHPINDSISQFMYTPDPLSIGTKIRLWGGSEESRLRWIPRTSLMLELGVPLTKTEADLHPICGWIDFLFENDITDWLTIGYDLGIYWQDWAPTPDIFASLGFSFSPTDKLGVFIESYNFFDPDAVSMTDPKKIYTVCDINLDFGLTYLVHPHVQLDIYAGFNLYHSLAILSTPRNNAFAGFGVTWLLRSPVAK